ncbi:MAG TPA: dienelactone hydrolase family protein [Gemmatimonadales bacterium]|nr:dienelactone hydrolase family protein [Gemmatimonadales bacterium]
MLRAQQACDQRARQMWLPIGARKERRMSTPRIDPDPLSPLNQMQRYLVHEFIDDYQDGLLSRRDLTAKIGYIAGGAAAATAILTRFGLDIDTAEAQEASATPQTSGPQSPISVPADDPAVSGADITFPSGGGDYTAYEARPAAAATPTDATPAANGSGLVLVCHENRGLTDHIRDVARRLAKVGYVACAVDLLSPEGGTAANNPDAIPGILTSGDINRHVQAFSDAISFYQQQGDSFSQRVGMVGFCFGGGITWRTTTQEDRLKAAVLGVYSDDPGDFANEGRGDLEAALKSAGITYRINIYPGTQHAFNNDTGQRYNEEQALAAWSDTLAWFAQYLV